MGEVKLNILSSRLLRTFAIESQPTALAATHERKKAIPKKGLSVIN